MQSLVVVGFLQNSFGPSRVSGPIGRDKRLAGRSRSGRSTGAGLLATERILREMKRRDDSQRLGLLDSRMITARNSIRASTRESNRLLRPLDGARVLIDGFGAHPNHRSMASDECQRGVNDEVVASRHRRPHRWAWAWAPREDGRRWSVDFVESERTESCPGLLASEGLSEDTNTIVDDIYTDDRL